MKHDSFPSLGLLKGFINSILRHRFCMCRPMAGLGDACLMYNSSSMYMFNELN